MYFYGYRQHQPHAFVNKLNYNHSNNERYEITNFINTHNTIFYYDCNKNLHSAIHVGTSADFVIHLTNAVR